MCRQGVSRELCGVAVINCCIQKLLFYGICYDNQFVDALRTDMELLATSMAAKGVEYCNRLFLLERKYTGEDNAPS